MSFFDIDRKFGFVHISKTGSIIEWTWRNYCGVTTKMGESRLFRGGLWIGGAHDDARIMRDLQPFLWGQSYNVGFVRNPWAWWLSAYFWYNEPRHTGFDFVKRFPTFREFILRWQEWRDGFPWQGYHGFLCDDFGNIIVSHVARTENMQQEFDAICDRTGFPKTELPTKTDRRDYREFYDNETKFIVAEFLSRKDLELFPYKFD